MFVNILTLLKKVDPAKPQIVRQSWPTAKKLPVQTKLSVNQLIRVYQWWPC